MKEIQKVRYDGYSYVEGGVCAAKGFRANGLYSGIKENPKKKPDLCLVFSDVPCHAAGVFTQNKVQAAPVTVSKKHLKQTGGKAQAKMPTPAIQTVKKNPCGCVSLQRRNWVFPQNRY